MLFCYVLRKVCLVFHLLTTKAFFNRYYRRAAWRSITLSVLVQDCAGLSSAYILQWTIKCTLTTMLFCYVLRKVCLVFHLLTTKAFFNRYCNDHVGEQEIKSKHDKDKRFHDDRLKNLVVIWKIFERKRPAEFRLSTRMHFIVVTRWVLDSA